MHRSKPNQVTVILGHHDFGVEQNDARRDVAVGQIIMHDQYKKQGAYSNDIAILRLARAVSFNSYISPICIPAADLDLDEKDAVVTGNQYSVPTLELRRVSSNLIIIKDGGKYRRKVPRVASFSK